MFTREQLKGFFFFAQLFNQSVQEVIFQLMRICYENLCVLFLHILTSLLFFLTPPRGKKSSRKRGIPPSTLETYPLAFSKTLE